MNLEDKELIYIFNLFFDNLPFDIDIHNTSRGDKDFREAIIGKWKSGEKYVIKLSDNDFTFEEKIKMWKRCAEEYRKCGYYCPAIFCSKEGDFPIVQYKNHNCVVYAEEYYKYHVAEERNNQTHEKHELSQDKIKKEAFIMTAKIADKRFDFTEYPSAYCLFDIFSSSDTADEVLENALEWKKYAETLPSEFQEQIRRIWQRWLENRNELEKIYPNLPTSVFQADLNLTNVLLDDNDDFAGIFDFNLCGKDVFLNYLFREIYWHSNDEDELKYILETLENVSTVYHFCDIEKQAAPLLYRCLKPLWFTKVKKLKDTGKDAKAIKSCLDSIEKMQTRIIDFESYMNSKN